MFWLIFLFIVYNMVLFFFILLNYEEEGKLKLNGVII